LGYLIIEYIHLLQTDFLLYLVLIFEKRFSSSTDYFIDIDRSNPNFKKKSNEAQASKYYIEEWSNDYTEVKRRTLKPEIYVYHHIDLINDLMIKKLKDNIKRIVIFPINTFNKIL